MAIQITCPNCDTALRVPDEMVGKKVRCKACQEIFLAREPRRRREDGEDDERPVRRRHKDKPVRQQGRPLEGEARDKVLNPPKAAAK
jgi:predicted Zn finger-like uncharacterized protein